MKKEELSVTIVNQKSDIGNTTKTTSKRIVMKKNGMITIKRCFVKDEVDSKIDSPEMLRKSDSNDNLVDSLIPPLKIIDLKTDDEDDDGSKESGKDKKSDFELKKKKKLNHF